MSSFFSSLLRANLSPKGNLRMPSVERVLSRIAFFLASAVKMKPSFRTWSPCVVVMYPNKNLTASCFSVWSSSLDRLLVTVVLLLLVDLSDAKAYYSRHKCSRFHQLLEIDQGKQSCHRRLVGHNERCRKPPPGSLLLSHFGKLSSSIIESSSGGGSFIMDFTTYQGFSKEMHGQQQDRWSAHLEIKTWLQKGHFYIPTGTPP